MAKKREKKGYEGFKLAGDTKQVREARAKKNAGATNLITNEVFAIQDTAFQQACEKADTKPTARQASKFRNGYGKAALAVGNNTRPQPKSKAI